MNGGESGNEKKENVKVEITLNTVCMNHYFQRLLISS